MRNFRTVGVAWAAIWLGGGCSNPTAVSPVPRLPFVIVDRFPAWSPDGTTLYFHRGFRSSLGPPGLYWTSWAGDTAAPVGVGDQSGPILLRASPDGTHLGGLWFSGLISIDLRNKAIAQLYATDNGVDSFDWDPGGGRVVVTRPLLAPGEDPDSSGLAILTLTGGTVAPIHVNNQPVFGTAVRWSPNGEWIAYVFSRAIYVVRPDGSARIQLTFPDRDHIDTLPRWLDGGDALLFTEANHLTNTWRNRVVSISNRTPSDWPVRVGDAEAITPNGQQVVVYDRDPTETTYDRFLFYLVGIDDLRGTSSRQLTFYEPATTEIHGPVPAVSFR